VEISIIVPIFNEAENLCPLYKEVSEVLENTNLTYEIILVDDGSRDASFNRMSELAASDQRVKVVRLRRNFGQTAAMAAGFRSASGEIIISMDGDLQNDPRDIPQLLAKMEEGYDVVSGWRKKRKDPLSKRLPSLIANTLISKMTGLRLHDYGCTLKAYRRSILAEVNLYGELHRFVPALAHQVGARVTEIPVNHRPRCAGASKYGIDRTMRVILDLMTVKFLLQYSTRPLQLFGKWAIGAFLASGVTGATTIYMKIFEDFNMNRNPLLVLTAFLLFTAVHFIAMGLLGELITRTYHEALNKPIYAIRKTINLESGQNSRLELKERVG